MKMKLYIFGIPVTGLSLIAGIFMLIQREPKSYFVPIAFTFAFSAGIVYWIIINFRESKRRKKENARRKSL